MNFPKILNERGGGLNGWSKWLVWLRRSFVLMLELLAVFTNKRRGRRWWYMDIGKQNLTDTFSQQQNNTTFIMSHLYFPWLNKSSFHPTPHVHPHHHLVFRSQKLITATLKRNIWKVTWDTTKQTFLSMCTNSKWLMTPNGESLFMQI